MARNSVSSDSPASAQTVEAAKKATTTGRGTTATKALHTGRLTISSITTAMTRCSEFETRWNLSWRGRVSS